MINMDINQNSIQQLETYPKLLRLISKVFRLCNDSATHSVRKQYMLKNLKKKSILTIATLIIISFCYIIM
jgi:hypothetical protein